MAAVKGDEHTPVLESRSLLLRRVQSTRMALRAHRLRAEYWRNRALEAEAELAELKGEDEE